MKGGDKFTFWLTDYGLSDKLNELEHFENTKDNGFWPGFWTLPIWKVGLWILIYEVRIMDI